MKKILYSVFMLATMVLAACSSDDTTEPVVKRGMVLKANVEDTDTRATITDTEGKWKFAFATKDVVKVGNDKVDGYYTFTNDGTVFTSTDAKQTTEAANWCAFFPGEKIDLTNQSGDFAAVANKYALAGATASATTGSDGLTVTMKAKAAVLRIVSVKKGEELDISVMTDGKYVSGLKAVKNSAEFSVETSPTPVSLLSKKDAGVYYVVVPAGVKLSVYNGEKLMKTTKGDKGLTAGKYYTLTSRPTKGEATAIIDGVEVKKKWVQLWPGGPKFAEENVAKKLNWTEATKQGDEYVWGANWRTPTKEELTFVGTTYDSSDDTYTLNQLNTKAEVQVKDKVLGILYTGIQPGYTDKSIFLPLENFGYAALGFYWTTTKSTQNAGTALNITCDPSSQKIHGYYFHELASTQGGSTYYWVRPVLAE